MNETNRQIGTLALEMSLTGSIPRRAVKELIEATSPERCLAILKDTKEKTKGNQYWQVFKRLAKVAQTTGGNDKHALEVKATMDTEKRKWEESRASGYKPTFWTIYGQLNESYGADRVGYKGLCVMFEKTEARAELEADYARDKIDQQTYESRLQQIEYVYEHKPEGPMMDAVGSVL